MEQPITQQSPIIQYKDVDLLRQNVRVVHDASLTVMPGEMVYLTGKVGSGKSSLLKSMYAEIPVAGGEARVLGYDLVRLRTSKVAKLRRDIGIVFQDFRLLTDRSVYDNLSFVLRATGWRKKRLVQERIMDVLTQVGMANKGYKMPYQLSGGEQQRIVIARAMLNSPRLILADEPTGNLDPDTGFRIMEQLQSICDTGTTIVMATHNLGFVKEFPGRHIQVENRTLSEAHTVAE